MLLKRVFFVLIMLSSLNLFCQINILEKVKKRARKGNLEEVKKEIDSLLKQKKNHHIKGDLFLEKVKILRIQGKNDAFQKKLDSVFEIAKKEKNKILEANALYQEYTYLNNKGGVSLPILAKYIAIAQETKDNKLLFTAYIKLTAIAIKAGNLDKAKSNHKKTSEYYKNWKKTDSIYPNLNLSLARIYDLEEKYDSVFIVLKRTLSQYKYYKRKRSFCQLYYLLGDNELTRKNYVASFEFLHNSYKWALKVKNKRFKEIAYTNMFRLLIALNENKEDKLKIKVLRFFNSTSLNEATSNFEKEYKNLTRLSPKQMALNNLSIAFKKLNDFEKAIFYQNKWSNFSVERIYNEQLNISNFMNLEMEISNLNKEKEQLETRNQLQNTQKIILILSTILLVIFSLFIWSQQRLKIKNEKVAKLLVEQQFLIATKERIELEKTLKEKEFELNSFIRDMIEKNSQIEILTQKLKNSKSLNSDELIEELNSKKYNASKNWVEFMFKFKQLYPDFINKLKNNIKNISPTETKLSVLSFLNLSSKEIGNILGISSTSVNQGKYRLKKKISLAKEVSLNDFLQKL
jgi:hypothetical protein